KLRCRDLGAEGFGRNAGPPGPCLEGAMSAVVNAVHPEKILKDLGELWTSLGEDEKKQGQPTVLRACAMTLIVVTDDEDEDALAASQTLVDLMHVHPSRAIVIRVASEPESEITARVLAQCWK